MIKEEKCEFHIRTHVLRRTRVNRNNLNFIPNTITYGRKNFETIVTKKEILWKIIFLSWRLSIYVINEEKCKFHIRTYVLHRPVE